MLDYFINPITNWPPNWALEYSFLLHMLASLLMPMFILFCPGAQDEDSILRRRLAEESNLAVYPGLVGEYAELAIQVGYVTLFGAAFPLAPVICFVNNMLERKTDALKLLKYCKKPPYKAAKSIGAWALVFETMSVLALVTNTLILIITSRSLCATFDCMYKIGLPSGGFTTEKIVVVMAIEHLFILIRLALFGLVTCLSLLPTLLFFLKMFHGLTYSACDEFILSIDLADLFPYQYMSDIL